VPHLNRREFLNRTAWGLAAHSLLKPAAGRGADSPASRRPNIVYVLVDQWRAQAFGYAGDPNVKTPHLDALAAQSVQFENAVSVCPVCTPHRAALMTGRYPLSTGMFLNDLYLPAGEVCMAELFKEAGYETAYIGKWHLDGHGRGAFIPRERRQGFDYWKVLECTHEYNASHYYEGEDQARRMWKGYDAFAQTEDAQAYIREHAKGGKPFLLVVSYGPPHFPHHTAPPEYKALYPADSIQLRPNVPDALKQAVQREAQGYYGHCTALDRCVGDLLKTLGETGAAKDTVFIFTSDHGEMLGSQGQPPCEKQRPWDESILVPFLARFPTATGFKGRSVRTPINTPDILPTLLSLAGIGIPATVEGSDLSRFIRSPASEEDRAALFMSVSPFAGYAKGPAYRGIRTSRHTYVRRVGGPWLLYDNRADPYQMNNLVGVPEQAGVQAELDARLQSMLRQTGDSFQPRDHYLREWGYEVDGSGAIPYRSGAKVQSPASRVVPST
jgi:arylsulfatase A-like enzyme